MNAPYDSAAFDPLAPPRPSTPRLVRETVTDMLRATPAFHQLPPSAQMQLAENMEKVGHYIVDAGGATTDVPMAAVVTPARSLMATTGDYGQPADPAAQPAFGDAAKQGVDNLGNAITKVDFPGFVKGLIDGVFKSIVSSSIDQMEAYATLLQNVAKTADQYMKDNISEDQAKDYLTSRYPDHLEADFSSESPSLAFRQDADEGAMPDFMRDLGLPFPIESMDDELIEEQLVPAARKKIAIDRQQMLLSLVLMGINRIVVTDGKISASVVFQLDTNSLAKQAYDQVHNQTFAQNESVRKGNGFWGWLTGADKVRTNASEVITVTTTNDVDNEEKQKLKVTLKGNVDLRFKSETFPLEKMADIMGLNAGAIQERAQPRPAPAPADPNAGVIPAPPMPTLA